MVEANRLDKNALLSPRFVWMASKETDEFTTRPETFIEGAGTSLKAAMDIVRKYGVVTDQLLPFKVQTMMFGGDENTFFATAATRKVTSYFNLQKNLAQWKSWIAAHGPILAGLSVDASWDNATNNHGKIDTFQPNTVRGGHAICVVGYARTASSSAIAGVPPGATKASGTFRRSTSTTPSSTSLTAFHCKTSLYLTGARVKILSHAPADSKVQDFLGVFHAALHVFALLVGQRGGQWLGGFARHVLDDHVALVGPALLGQRQEAREVRRAHDRRTCS